MSTRNPSLPVIHAGSPLDIECPVCKVGVGVACDFKGENIRAIEVIHHERIDAYFGEPVSDEALGAAVENVVSRRLF